MKPKMGMKEVIEGSQRLNRYMQSVDDSLNKLLKAFNDNMTLFNDKLDNLEKLIKEKK